MNGRSWSRRVLVTALVSILFAPALAAATIDIDSFDLPPGKTVTIEVEVTVDSPMPPGDSQVCNQGTITGTNLSPSVLTDDPDAGMAADPTCTNIQLIADLSVTKTDGSATEVPGTTVTYTIVASNAGPATVADGLVVDTFPGILSGCSTTSVAAGGASGNDAGPFAGNINDSGLTIPLGGTVTYTSTCTIAAGATGTLDNTVTISSAATTDSAPGNNTDTDSDTLVPSADVQITKTDGSTTEIPGTPVTYTIVASNSGPSTATGVTVADTFPASLSGCSTTSVVAGGATGNDAGPTAGNINDGGITLPPSATVTYTATCNIAPTATGSLANTATITSATADPSNGNNSATDTDTLSPQADLSISKTDGSATEVPGTPVTYTIVVANTAGPSEATGVTVADTFAGILSGCSTTSVAAGGATGNDAGPAAGNINDGGITLPVGSSITYTATCNIDAAATGSLVNTATVTSGITDPNNTNDSATDTDTLVASADVSISKTDGSATEVPGTPVTYTIVVTNAGPSTAASVTVSDTFPGSLSGCSTTSVASGGATGNDAGPSAGNISDSGITLPSGSSVTYTATCNIDAAATGSLANTASVTSATADPNGGNNTATDTDTLVPSADVAISKTDGLTSVSPGAPITYTIVASNAGPSTASSVTVADTFVVALTGCSTTSVAAGGATGNDPGPTAGDINDGGITLPPGGSVTYTAACTLDIGATVSVSNTATITTSTTDPSAGNNSATDTDTIQPLDYGDAPNAALNVAFNYKVSQAEDGARHVATGVTLGATRDDEIDGLPSINADGDDNDNTDDEDGVTFPNELVACGTTTLTINASGSGIVNAWIDWNRDGDWQDAGEQLQQAGNPDIAVSAGANLLSVSPPCGLNPGNTYARFRISAAGGLATTGQAANGEVEDYLVTIYGLDFGDAPASFPVTLASDGARHIVRTTGPQLGALGGDTEADGQPGANASLDDLTGTDDEDGVVITSLIVPGQSATVQITASAAGQLNGWVDWNADGDWGDSQEQIFTNEALTAGVNNLNFNVPPGAVIDTLVAARFRVATVGATTVTGLAQDGEVEDYLLTVAKVANLAVTKTDGSPTEVPGTNVVYTIVASNAGPSSVVGAAFGDTFAGSLSGCAWTSVAAGGAAGGSNSSGAAIADALNLPAGSSVTYTVTCNIDAAATGSLANTASIGVPMGVFDSNPGNNTSTDTDSLVPTADLAITKTDGSATEVPGTPVSYTIVVSNSAGPSVATGVTVTDTFAGTLSGCSTTSVVAGGATGNDAGPTAGDLNDGGITLPVGASVTYTATCNIAQTATGNLVNTASVTSAITDPTPANDSATDTDTLTPQVDVAITKTDGSATEVPGTPATYTIVVTNAAGPSTATGVSVTDTFAGILSGCSTTSVAAGGATGNVAGPAAGNINNGGITLPTGSSVTYTATCNISAAATGSLVNTASVTVDPGITDTNPANDSATDTDTLQPEADLAITKTDGSATAVPGTPVTYTIVVSNASGPSTATEVTVTDNFAGILSGCSTTSVAAGGATGNDAGPVAGDVNDGGIILPPGSSVTYSAICNISAAATGSLVNTASVTSPVTDPNGANNSATDTDTLNKETDLAITKISDANPVAANQVFNYQITVQNIGPSDSVGFTVTDTLPAASSAAFVSASGTGWACGAPVGLTLTCTHGGLISGATTAILQVQMQVAAVPSPPNFTNTATVSTVENDPVSGNNTASVLVSTDTTPPTIDNVDSNEGSGDGVLAACETVRGRVNGILIQFSEPMALSARTEAGEESSEEVLAVGDADDVASYLLVQPGGNATFDTVSCAGGVQGDDIAVFLGSATYQANTPSAPSGTVTLSVTDHGRLQSGLYRLIACGSLHDLANNSLGADFVRDFRVDAFDLFANAHFDCGSASWQAQDAVWTGAADYQASPHSGAVRATQDNAFVDQCVNLGSLSPAREQAPYDLRGRLRLDPLANSAVAYSLSCVFFDGADCAGNATPATGVVGSILAPTGSWLNVRYRFQSLPAGALSARCGFDLDSLSPFTAEVDALNFRGNGVIFEDGFELGNTSKWQ